LPIFGAVELGKRGGKKRDKKKRGKVKKRVVGMKKGKKGNIQENSLERLGVGNIGWRVNFGEKYSVGGWSGTGKVGSDIIFKKKVVRCEAARHRRNIGLREGKGWYQGVSERVGMGQTNSGRSSARTLSDNNQ